MFPAYGCPAVTMADRSSLLVFSVAVRFGRIPKREKQRLLDEMQSYMNSLNESAAMDMDSSLVRDSPSSPEEDTSKEAIGVISRAYHDIFTSSSSISQERPAKRAHMSTSNNKCPFSHDATFSPASSHPNSAQSYQSCPVAPNDNQSTFHNVNNNHYTYLVSTNQNHGQSNGAMPQRGSSDDHKGFCNAARAANQPSCPWKVAPGAKVLVSSGTKLNYCDASHLNSK